MRRRHYRINRHSSLLVSLAVIFGIAALLAWWIVARRPFSFLDDGLATSSTVMRQQATSSEEAMVAKTDRHSQTINSLILELPELSQFKALYLSTGVAAAVTTAGEYTLFVPTNAAFGQLPLGTVAQMNKTERERLVEQHIVVGHAIDVGTDFASYYLALSNDMLTFSYGIDNIPMVNAAIITKEYVTKNGTLYLIDNVLLPPKKADVAQ